MEQDLSLDGFDPDDNSLPAMAFLIRVDESRNEIPFHQHRKGQLVLALHGGVICQVEKALWMVPTQSAVWIPGMMLHSNRATENARLCFLFIEPDSVQMPEQCCTLKISPLVRELILHLAMYGNKLPVDAALQRLIGVLFEQLTVQPVEKIHLPVSEHPKIKYMADCLIKKPQVRRTLSQWASELAMSERSLARLIVKETGLNFRHWKQQLQIILALRMLLDGESVQKVSGVLGYDSTNAFITMFKKALGKTPGRYIAALNES